ncbi:MAG: L,D-transpeptidase family protein [Planctomycetes bacterium]|nr:L,D-transpeptidase family protein [Planctomycetota bacterium]
MIAAFILSLSALLPNLDDAPAPKPTMAELVASATRDPAAVVPLILEAGTAMTTLSPEAARVLGDTLEPFCDRAFFSPERLPGMERLGLVLHKVAKGENPTKIAQRYRIGAGMLAYLNEGYDEKKLRIGQELKVLDLSTATLSLTVAKGQHRLIAWRSTADGRHTLVRFCAVGLGAAESPTPVGRTTITKRVLKPAWTDPTTNIVYAPDDPGNVLGGYWIALDAAGLGRSGIGFHGYTGAPVEDWISKNASHGCVRMLQPDVDRVFHLAIEGTSVTIVD